MSEGIMSDHMTTDPATARVAAAKDVGRRLADCAICGASAPPTAWNRRPAVGEDVVDELANVLMAVGPQPYTRIVAKMYARAIIDHLNKGE